MIDGIIIIGGGFAGAVTAIKLAELGCTAPVTIVEPRAQLGRGIAYSTTELDHLVNGPARRFGLYPDDPDHLPRWLAAHPDRRGWPGPKGGDFGGCFPPRILYGDYVQSELAKVGARHEVDTVTDLSGDGEVSLASGRRIRAARIVLATGLMRNEGSFVLGDDVRSGGRYVADPWSTDAYRSVGPTGDIAVIGGGLTMLDVVISLEKRGFRGRYFVFSRRGHLVRSRREVEPWPVSGLGETLPRTALGVLRRIRRELRAVLAAGDDWQRLVLALRPHVDALWAGADDIERRRFARHLRRYWDLAFHRAVPDSQAWLDRVRAQGRLFNLAGSVRSLVRAPDGGIDMAWHSPGVAASKTRRFDHVVNAAGHDADWRRISSPLVRNLVTKGLVRPHPVGFGIVADPGTGIVIDATGHHSRHLLAVGHPLRGAMWESSSIPEQIAGATRVAQAISISGMRRVA